MDEGDGQPTAISVLDWEAAQQQRNISPTEAHELLKPLARLDGFDIFLRSVGVSLSTTPLTEPQSWTVPVRVWRVQPDWLPPTIEGDNVRPEYVAAAIDPKTKLIRPEFLTPDCIEGSDLNLSAGRYRPTAALAEVQNVATTADQIRKLLAMEREIQANLEHLLSMVEGAL
jgi:hypothetical protein